MDAEYRAFFEFLGKLGRTMDQLTELARKKTAAVRHDDLLAVDECLKQEQVLSLSLRGMDKKREKMLADLGLSNVPLSGLAAACPEHLRREASQAAESLRRKFDIYNSAADTARTTLECNLHEIEKYLDGASGGGPSGSIADIRA